MSPLRYRTLAHTADVRLVVWGDDERALLANAIAGTIALALGRRTRGDIQRWAAIAPWPHDARQRLVAAVNEALYQLYGHRAVAVDLRLKSGRAWLGLADLPSHRRLRVEIKAATFHDLALEHREGRLRAVLTLDL